MLNRELRTRQGELELVGNESDRTRVSDVVGQHNDLLSMSAVAVHAVIIRDCSMQGSIPGAAEAGSSRPPEREANLARFELELEVRARD